ncbi:DUF3006 domain-containing protein [Texcoconibacillus texcoconensis]|uniref:DUF3006 domain-containing protein n=1 Tax=Texcoconibacillus texcoconensis TaxID=1095777 RepID=A0A840QTT7_9BACI|nr:DUF3006 domain-containing protein [Texcoconibacillus texcoconensis]MBB5174701.1 hypothetical protein [Texcoconibacillus texcoconensis]
MEKAVIDRVVDEQYVVLLVGDEQEELIVSTEELPQNTKEGALLSIKREGNQVKNITVNEEETKSARDRIANKKAQLRKRKGSQFKRK